MIIRKFLKVTVSVLKNHEFELLGKVLVMSFMKNRSSDDCAKQ